MKTIYFGIAGYPEIKRVSVMIIADTRPGQFLREAMCARVVLNDWKGIVCFQPEDPQVMNHLAVIQKAKECVDYQRKKRGICSKGGA